MDIRRWSRDRKFEKTDWNSFSRDKTWTEGGESGDFILIWKRPAKLIFKIWGQKDLDDKLSLGQTSELENNKVLSLMVRSQNYII